MVELFQLREVYTVTKRTVYRQIADFGILRILTYKALKLFNGCYDRIVGKYDVSIFKIILEILDIP